jgi:hypothetical protein
MSSQVNSSILGFFRDPDASSVLSLAGQQIISPTVRGQDLTMDEIGMGGGVRIVIHVIDRSPSMEPVTKLVLDGFSGLYVEAIKEARQDDVAALRLGGITFSSDITQIWVKNKVAFHPVEELPALTSKEFNPLTGNGTALHQAIVEGYNLALKFAAQVLADTGIQPEIDVITLTDGQNNYHPYDPDSVYSLIKGSKPELVRFVFFYFETTPGAGKSTHRKVNPKFIAEDLGYDSENVMVFDQKDGETKEEQKKRFRRMLRVMSRVSASKGTSAVAAAAAVQVATPEEELV